jgi:unsaturated rhamnogalacturonyl hydrolase
VADASASPPERRALDFIARYLTSWQPYRPYWNYEDGCIYKGLLDLAEATRAEWYFDYARREIGARTSESGELTGFEPNEFNIDNVNAGKALFTLFARTAEPRFRLAIEAQHSQLERHPRTQSGNYWHKKIYPHQVWLDGLYMAQPFRCAYARQSGRHDIFTDVLTQFANVRATMRDEATGLYYHGWDESRTERWSNPQTGCSPCFWGRAMGWFMMALVDCLELFADIPDGGASIQCGRDQLTALLVGASDALMRVKTANELWYQVLDQGSRKGNYEESSASLMISYALMKGARLGALSTELGTAGASSLRACIARFVTENDLSGICAVAGLGNVPYRDGSYEYYLSEPVVANDPKGVGALMMATAEYLRAPYGPPPSFTGSRSPV